VRSIADRFWVRVDKGAPDECWPWVGAANASGYGRISVAPKLEYAHRVSFFLHHGRWPHPCCLHRCDNPSCVNPGHLFEGTHAENAADKCAKGRHHTNTRPGSVLRGNAHGRAKLSDADVQVIRMLARMGTTHRELANWYRVDRSTVSLAVSGKNWRTVT
jgi:hypothetical protein